MKSEIFDSVFPSSADGETGEDVVRALGGRRAPPGSAGLGQGAVGGHVWRKAAHKHARQSFMSMNWRVDTGKCDCFVGLFFFFFLSSLSIVSLTLETFALIHVAHKPVEAPVA